MAGVILFEWSWMRVKNPEKKAYQCHPMNPHTHSSTHSYTQRPSSHEHSRERERERRKKGSRMCRFMASSSSFVGPCSSSGQKKRMIKKRGPQPNWNTLTDSNPRVRGNGPVGGKSSSCNQWHRRPARCASWLEIINRLPDQLPRRKDRPAKTRTARKKCIYNMKVKEEKQNRRTL